MGNDPAFLFYPGDYLRDTQNLSEKSQVAYDRIMCEHMRNICISYKQLKFFTKRLNEDELDELMLMLEEKNGGYQIKWVADSIEKRRKYSESRRNNRKGKTKKKSKSYVNHMENEIENVNENENEIEVYPTFDDFWNLYDKKTDSKTKCNSKWKKLNQKTKEEIINHVPLYVASTPDKKFRKNPSTYLNNEGWTHEIINNNEKGFVKSLHDQFKDDPYYKSI